MGFKLRLEYQEDINMYNIILKVYFHYKLVNNLFEKSKKHACLSKLFDESGFLDDTIFKIDYLDKMLNKIYLNDTEYITIELR